MLRSGLTTAWQRACGPATAALRRPHGSLSLVDDDTIEHEIPARAWRWR